MTIEVDETTAPMPDSPAVRPAAEGVRPASAARESLSWIRALASQWEDDFTGPPRDSAEGQNPR